MNGAKKYFLNIDKINHVNDHLFVHCFAELGDNVDLTDQRQFTRKQRQFLNACHNTLYTKDKPPRHVVKWFKQQKQTDFYKQILARKAELTQEAMANPYKHKTVSSAAAQLAADWVEEFHNKWKNNEYIST